MSDDSKTGNGLAAAVERLHAIIDDFECDTGICTECRAVADPATHTVPCTQDDIHAMRLVLTALDAASLDAEGQKHNAALLQEEMYRQSRYP